MQMVGKTLLALLVLLGALVLFAPKKELYYRLEKGLQVRGVVLDGEKIRERPLGVQIDGARVYYEGIELGTLSGMTIQTLLVYSRAVLVGFTPSEAVRDYLPIRLERAELVYALWHPTRIGIHATGNFGELEGSVDLREHRVLLRWKKKGKAFGALRRYLKRDREGWYYELRY